ncbi:MAG TPA: hypothetical protein VL422_02425 [Miltoncostaea sp.]|jgi:hypothetical protein|nr:hypothetical protein [Miltoncostaea sp.]
MICILTERRLKPGSWDDFRRAWEPAEPPPVGGRAYHARDLNDPDHVISFGLFDVDLAEFQKLGQDPRFAEIQKARFAAMAPFVTETGADGIFEVIEVVEEPGSGG